MPDLRDYLPPTVVGPLSPHSRTITVQGIRTGGLVSLYQQKPNQPRQVIPGVGGVGSWHTMEFRLPHDVQLEPGDLITASQGDSDPNAPLQAVTVLQQVKSPSDLGPVAMRGHLYAGAECLWIDGAVPGAVVMIWADNQEPASTPIFRVGGIVRHLPNTGFAQTPIGSAEATYGGSARVTLTRPVAPNDRLYAQQNVETFSGPLVALPAPDSLAVPGTFHGEQIGIELPAPRIEAPLYACQTSLAISGILEGATVTLFHQGTTSVESGCVDRTGVWMPVPGVEVVPGDFYYATQAFPAYGAASPPSTPARAPVLVSDTPGAVIAPPPPRIGTVCWSDTGIPLSNLIVGAEVDVGIGPDENGHRISLGWTMAPSETYTVPLKSTDDVSPAAIGKGTLYVAQRTCWRGGDNTGWSALATTKPGDYDFGPSAPTIAPALSEPTYECARAIHVTNAWPGLTIRVISKRWGVIGTATSSAPWFVDGEGDIPVSPSLLAGDTLHIEAVVCGDGALSYVLGGTSGSGASPSVSVQSLPSTLPPPSLPDPVRQVAGSITVRDVVPGSSVSLFVRAAAGGTEYFAGSAMATLDVVGVPLLPHVVMHIGDRVRASVSICSRDSSSAYSTFVGSGADPVLIDPHPTQIGCAIAGDDPVPPLLNVFHGSGTDLGVPADVIMNGEYRTYFFFGDTAIPLTGGLHKVVGYTTQSQPFNGPCLRLSFLTGPDGRLQGLTAPGTAGTALGVQFERPFNVPTGAFVSQGRIYLFAMGGRPDTQPNEGNQDLVIGHGYSFLLRVHAEDVDPNSDSIQCENLKLISSYDGWYKFLNVSPTVVDNTQLGPVGVHLQALAGVSTKASVLLFGSGPGSTQGYVPGNPGALDYRSGNMCLAWMPLSDDDGSPLTEHIWYFVGPDPYLWSTNEHDAQPLIESVLSADPAIGELSVFWDNVLARWILLYNSSDQVAAKLDAPAIPFFYASEPWGPWSTLEVPQGLDSNSLREAIERRCVYSGWRDQPPVPPGYDQKSFNVYGPYRILRYGTWNPWRRTWTIYFSMSTYRNSSRSDFAIGYRSRIVSTTFQC